MPEIGDSITKSREEYVGSSWKARLQCKMYIRVIFLETEVGPAVGR